MSRQVTADRPMQALRAHRRGGPEELVYEQAPRPPLGIGDALVEVHTASFTPTELDWPSTWTDRLGRERNPVIPGHEVSGVVAALGFGTTGVTVGQEVYGLTDWYRDGAAADYVAVEARNLAPKPTTLDHVQAAALPLAGLTAWQALFDHGRLQAGQWVLIHGTAGGVGSLAVQLAHGAGAQVIGSGRAPDHELLAKLGAEKVVDVERQRFEEVAGRVDAGELQPVVGRVWPLAEGRQAFQAKQHGGLPGKVVLQVADNDEELSR